MVFNFKPHSDTEIIIELTEIDNLLEEIKRLEKTIAAMEITIESINDLRTENAELRKSIPGVEFQTFKTELK